MKEYLKNNQGITMISLVITIVVLIILAAVAINLSLGNNGIFNRAKTAKEKYQNAQDYEQTGVGKASNDIDSFVGGDRTSTAISNNYSTEEQVVGKWVNGKPIYQRTYIDGWTLPSPTSGTVTETQLKDLSSLNIDTVIRIEAMDNYNPNASTNTWIQHTQLGGGSSGTRFVCVTIALKNSKYTLIGYNSMGYGIVLKHVTIQYTKTTD